MTPQLREETVIVNDRDRLVKFYEKHRNDIYVGFNIRQYDQYIMKAILCDFNPKEVNDHIIVKKQKGWQFSDVFHDLNINIFDVMTTFHGLKTLEGFMGNNIEETGVDFNIDRKLTPAEIAETIKYCRHDVEQTIEVFLRREEEFDAHIGMLKAFGLPKSFVSKTKVQLSAAALGAVKRERNDEFDLTFPNTMQIKRYMDIPLWYLNPNNRYERDEEGNVVEKKFYDTMVAGVPHTFAWGGLHGARENYIEEGQFLNVDVASYYPSLMIEYGFLSRNVSDPKKYTEIYKQRLKYKAEKNPLQAPLKIVLNGTYGAMKDRYNPLYDPLQANNVCVGGQLLLLDLIEKLEDYCDIIQSNTDGILVKLRDNREQVEGICREWMERTRMVLEFDGYVKVIQRDVNNYIIVAADGSYKSKGSVVKKNHELDNDTTILNEAVINYFVKGIPVELTINGCTDLIKFQRIVKVSSKYDYAMHGTQISYNKTFRVFASTDPNDGGIFKVKSGKNPEKFANTPEHCFIMNGNITGVSIPDKLDRQFYIDMANRHVQQFLGTLKKGK
jgi:DNA polymerase elongation subunit (family B)